MNTLHIVDGESTGGTLKLSGIARRDEILCWRDALYTGPVPAVLSLRQLSRVRSRFWTKGKRSGEFNKRDTMLARHEDYEHIVLWFGPGCALCQLSLAQVLSWFREHRTVPARLSWVPLHGGELRPEQMSSALAKRRPISAEQMRLNDRLWRVFRKPTPAALVRLLQADTKAVPGLQRVVRWLLQEYPSCRNGLSRMENVLLRELKRVGTAKAARVVCKVMIRTLGREGVGDQLLFDVLRSQVSARPPLVQFAEPFKEKIQSWKFNGSTLTLTAFGRLVLAGRADAVAMTGIDRWIGGVHLHGCSVRWRWDGKTLRYA